MRQVLSIFFLSFCSTFAYADTPEWIWTEEEGNGPFHFSRLFEISDAVPDDCRLTVTADFAAVDVVVNGNPVGQLESYDPVKTFAIADFLKTNGENQVELLAYPTNGPSAIAAEIQVTFPDNELHLKSGAADWSGSSVIGKGPVLPERWAPDHLPEVSAQAEYNQWKEALDDPSAKSISPLAPGFTLTKLRDSGEDEDSWVSLAIDPQGRLIVAQEHKGLLRFVISDNGEKVTEVERINENLEECRGLAFRGETLFANANDSKALFRLRDTNHDDQYDEVTEIQATTGSVGHGRNDLALGPDGHLHSIHGDVVNTPDRTTFLTAAEPGHSKPLGHWLTTGHNDAEWKVLARGLRNPYGIDFHKDGSPFTYDADNEGDVGLPFYRPSRINHLVPGANYGWHQRPGNTRSIPVYAPDSVPTTFDVGRGSPTGVKFGYRSHFPAPWNKALFALDWAYGRIIAIHLIPRGGSYYASGEIFLEGRPLNVTDLDFAADGSMYFVTGGRKTKSALYRVAFEGKKNHQKKADPTTQAAKRADFSKLQRMVRQQIERDTAAIGPDSLCWLHLGSRDPWMRNAARVTLEKRPVDEWREQAAKQPAGLAQLTALLALTRQGTKEDRIYATESASIIPTESWRRTEKLTFLRICELGLSQEVGGAAKQSIATCALSWINDPADPVTRESVRILAQINHLDAVETTLTLLNHSSTQEDRLHYMEMLGRMRNGWTEDSRSSFFKSLAIARDTSRGDRFMPPFFEAIQNEALANAPENERNHLAGLLKVKPSDPETETAQRPFVQNWTLDDFTDEDFRSNALPTADEGLALFRAGHCHRCHSFGAEGYPVGPDLTRVGSRFSAPDLLHSIVEPSAVVSEVFRNHSIELHDGTTVTGRLLRDDFRQSLLYVSTNPFAPTETTKIPKDQVKQMTQSKTSTMPPGLLSSFQKKEIIALLQWLLAGPGKSATP